MSLREKSYQRAVVYFKQLLQVNLKNPNYHQMLASSYMHTNSLLQAYKHYKKAILLSQSKIFEPDLKRCIKQMKIHYIKLKFYKFLGIKK
jgi:tetratricopeptide (TPR) repeat protein